MIDSLGFPRILKDCDWKFEKNLKKWLRIAENPERDIYESADASGVDWILSSVINI